MARPSQEEDSAESESSDDSSNEESDYRSNEEGEETDSSDDEDEDEESEESEEEEEDDAEVEDDAEDENSEMDQIINRIEKMSDSEIGACITNNSGFIAVAQETNRIRSKYTMDNYKKLYAAMTAFTENETMIEAFENFRGVTQFIMHIHKVYNVKLDVEVEHSDLIVDTIRNVLGK